MESERAMFKALIVEEADKSCGLDVTGVCHGGNLKTHRWTLMVKEAIKLKKEAFQSWLA